MWNRIFFLERPGREFPALADESRLHRGRPMRYALASVLVIFTTCMFVQAAAPDVHSHYRLGKAPKSEFHVGGRTFPIDPESLATKRLRAIPPMEFDPTTRRQRVDDFYRRWGRDHAPYARRHHFNHDYGPYRHEFLELTYDWDLWDRARWAWNNRVYFDDVIWNQWMAEPAFASLIDKMQRANAPVETGYLPPQAASLSPAVVYNDAYMDSVYNPIPFLAVLSLKNLKPDKKTDWIATAASDSLLSNLSSTPGIFVADNQDVTGVLQSQKVNVSDVTDPGSAVRVGKSLDVEHVVVGSYVVDGDKVLFNLRIVDVETGAVQTGFSKTVPRKQLLDEMPHLATSLAAALGYSTPPDIDPSEQTNGQISPTAPVGNITPAVASNGEVRIVSKWHHYGNGKYMCTLSFYSDGRLVTDGDDYDGCTATYSLDGDALTLKWHDGGAQHALMSSSGNSYSGTDNNGSYRFTGERVTDDLSGSPRTPFAGVTPADASNGKVRVVSKWRHYVNGNYNCTVSLYSDGRLVKDGDDYDHATATWSLDGYALTLKWPSGKHDHALISSSGDTYDGDGPLNHYRIRGERVTDGQ